MVKIQCKAQAAPLHAFPCGGRERPVAQWPPPWHAAMAPMRGQVVLAPWWNGFGPHPRPLSQREGEQKCRLLWKTNTPQPLGHGANQYLVELDDHLLVCWSVGLLVCWSVGLLVCWPVGLLACWPVGLWACGATRKSIMEHILNCAFMVNECNGIYAEDMDG
jgi:hypothetical protein